ncbi:MAG: hypothetical protein DRP42_05735 [Tenericutes bacterium]|nr:MAG: hypothetical protein DRP42_05735 [Mycoplasmatota bacterium]
MSKVCEDWFEMGSYKGQRSPGFYMNNNLKDTIDLWVKNVKNDWDFVIIISGQGTVRVGKTQTKGSKVLMSNGSWKNVEDIRIGDKVISPNIKTGKHEIATVKDLHNRFEEDCYDVVENSNKTVLYSCAGNHDVPIEYVRNIRRVGKDKVKRIVGYRKIKKTMEAQELFNKTELWYKDNSVGTYQGFLVEKFEGQKNPEIDPYCFGYAMGDGCFTKTSLSITSETIESMKYICDTYPPMRIGLKKGTPAKDYFYSVNSTFNNQVKALGLKGTNSGTKFIPDEIKTADAEYRFKFIAGLVDSDGYVDQRGNIGITLKSKKLVEDIIEVVRSLGGFARISKKKKGIKSRDFVGTYYHTQINFGKNTKRLPLLNKFKKDRLKLSPRKTNIGFRVKKRNGDMVYGFELDSESKLYITDNYTITHNSVLAQQIACYWTYAIWKAYDILVPFDTKDNIVFHGSELIKKGNKLGRKHKYGTLIFDEAGADLEGVKAMQKTTQNVKDFFRECGQYNMLNILCLPEFFDLPKGIATNRSNALIDCYVTVDENDMWERGKFNFYSAPSKKKLYRYGKKDADYSATKCDYYGDWDNVYVLDEKEYKAMKIEALKTREVMSKREEKRTSYLKGAFKVLMQDFGLTQVEVAEKIGEKQKIRTNHRYIGRLLVGENPEDEDD